MIQLPKHIMLSRKGFDSAAGGAANWLYNGKLYPIPIPEAYSHISYKDLTFDSRHSYYDVMKDLGIKQYSECHFDPDIVADRLANRPKSWRPLFGQTGAALTHLINQGVTVGDLFLFFGWFKEIELVNHKFRYKPKSPDLHIIWGYLEIGEIVDLKHDTPKAWMSYHPHLVFKEDYESAKIDNFLYVATQKSATFPNRQGATIFDFNQHLTLTDTTQQQPKKSLWKLPSCFFDSDKQCLLSYHEMRQGSPSNKRGWYKLQSVGRGQEFVLNTQQLSQHHKASLKTWLTNLLTPSAHE